MEYTLRIPTNEPYAYIEIVGEGTPEEALGEYRRLTGFFKGVVGQGVDTKTFNALLDEYLKTGTITNGGDVWENLNADQQMVFQEIKKSFKRWK